MSTNSPAGTLEAIPSPPGRPFVGNLFDLDVHRPVQSIVALARTWGPIFQLNLPGRRQVVVSGHALVDEVCDERRFDKQVWAPLQAVRAFAGDGLFTAWTHEPNWRRAHNILIPNFGARAMQGYMPQMVDLAAQLVGKWARLNPSDEVDVPADMTRLTLDTIGLCGFGYRFNSFYREEPHPFIVAMVRALGEALDQLHRLPIQERLMVRKHRQFQEDIATMNGLVDQIIRDRRASTRSGEPPTDLLGHMLASADRASGERLDDLNIRYQIITFLIAGHETTSGLLSFALYYLLKHPDVLARAYEEVDRVLGADEEGGPTFQQVHQLTYIRQILNESLRLWPTAPAFALYPREPTVIGGRYAIDKRHSVMVLIPMLHRDQSIWGDDAERFDPERFAPERERARPPSAFKPFGNGERACIGRQFAMQEAALVLGMLLRRFELVDHRDYQLEVKETLTLKPHDLRIMVRPRTARSVSAAPAAPAPAPVALAPDPIAEAAPAAAGHDTPLLVLYGSNLGTAEELARRIEQDATARGFATTIAALDAYAGKLPTDGAVAVVTASYNGQPPDEAVRFCEWLRAPGLPSEALRGVRYTVFGCGNRDWASTYQAIPRLVDERLAALGAERVHPRGEGDARDDFDGQFRAWYGPLWTDLAEALQIDAGGSAPVLPGHRYEVETIASEPTAALAAAYGARPLPLRVNRELQRRDGPRPSERSTRHVEVALPAGWSYRAGDYLGVLPRNGLELVRRAAAHFGLSPEDRVRVHSNTGAKTHLPLDTVVSVGDLLADYVELQDVATRAQIQVLAEYNPCPPERQELLALASDDPANVARYRDAVLSRRVSVLDLLEAYRGCQLTLNIFLELLTPLRPRYYSICSSPLVDPATVSITVAVVEGPARSGNGQYRGVCSSYVAGRGVGEALLGFVKDPSTPFRPPADPARPVIMVGPGTGLAPFRGFLQERAALSRQGRELGPALLFFGCRDPEQDYIYRDELEAWQAEGIVEVDVAFSRVPGQPRAYVQDRIGARQGQVWRSLEAGAVVYVCGDASRMAPDVRRAFAAVYRAATGADEPAATAWLAGLDAAGRYVADVWAS